MLQVIKTSDRRAVPRAVAESPGARLSENSSK
jgi:hypothetical protein